MWHSGSRPSTKLALTAESSFTPHRCNALIVMKTSIDVVDPIQWDDCDAERRRNHCLRARDGLSPPCDLRCLCDHHQLLAHPPATDAEIVRSTPHRCSAKSAKCFVYGSAFNHSKTLISSRSIHLSSLALRVLSLQTCLSRPARNSSITAGWM